MKEKLIAGLLAALTTLTTVYPVLAAGTLGDFPGLLGAPSEGFLVVVGAAAKPEDVVGAADIAMSLAVQSTTDKSVPGAAAAVTGLEYNTLDFNFGNLTDAFPDPIRSFHYSGLLQGTISWKSNTYDYHETINLSTAGSSNKQFFSHDFGTAGINGTEKMVLYSGRIGYEYVFDKQLNLSSATTAGTTGTLASPEYTYPVNVKLLGTTFQIVAVGSNQIKMLVGSSGTADATTPVVYGTYSVYATLGSNTAWSKVVVKDSAGNTVDSMVINQADSKDSSAAGLTIKVTAVRALQDGTIVGADLVVGPMGSVEKTYTTTCDVTGTGVNDLKFPGTSDWCIQVVGFATSGLISSGDKIQVVWKPTTSPQYFKAGEKLSLPNSYGDIGFEGWNYNTFATLTFTPKTGLSAYYLSAIGGSTNSSILASNLNGIEIASDVAGTILVEGTGYQKAYLLFGVENSTTNWLPVYVGVWDSVNSRMGVVYDAGHNGTYMKDIAKSSVNCTASPGGNCTFAYNFTISYGGGASTADQQYLYANVSVVQAASPIGETPVSIIRDFTLGTSANGNAIQLGYYNKTGTWSTTSPPDFRLYTSDSAEAKDIHIDSTDTSGTVNTQEVGVSTQDVVTDAGTILVNPSSNSAGQIVVIKVPAQALKVKAYIGKLGVAAGAQTYKEFTPVTVAIARLDTEVSATDKTKNLVVVGGPCVNSITAAALGLTFPACGAASGVPENAALIKVVKDYPATGKYTVVVAGWEATNTRTACAVIQQYATLLKGQTATAVKVTAATAAGITAV